ncbi:Rad3-related DNA helicase [Halopenitus malekzadehii]|uniref:Rad3-related DNA helicase n=1 Tax=Halopenitus malekzadehii TaxID=1267564 RepID=A0A1H6IQN5_9EURY|nr:ATP-dependent DNA helicase [Halopenitus malekzadehii]SEH48936.1 Rad3-related DNA helicase [Halopenitus malekzadehii]
MDPDRIPAEFPAPSFRGAQEHALQDINDAFAAGNDVVLVRAPTGSGKSLLARSIMGAARSVEAAEPRESTGAYYTTPQVSQLDDVATDDLLDDLNVIRGKSNYACVLPGEHDTPVDRAPCARQRGFDCSIQHRCPYFSDRSIASSRRFAAMTLAYFMQTAGSEVFGTRDVVVIDEAHGLAEWAEMYATIELTPDRVPVWEDVGVPDVSGESGGHGGSREGGGSRNGDGDGNPDHAPLDRTARFVEQLRDACERAKDELVGRPELEPAEVARRDRLQELIGELGWFLEDYRDPRSPTTWVVDQPGGEGTAITIKPLDPARYLKHTVWDRGNRFALLSATILSKEAFCRGVGLDPADVALVDVEHTFPLENRPLYDVTQGKMTYEHRAETIPRIADLVVRLMARHPDEKGLIHAHSYAIAEQLVDRLRDRGVAPRMRSHTKATRDDELEVWKASDDPEVFVSVKMEEALDLRDDLCRWQVICKAPYLNTNDSRVARRLEEGQWAWYHRAALRTVIQACGRVVRAPDDHGTTYLADDSLLDLFDRARADTPPWFADQVAAMRTPDLPAADPSAALSGVNATPSPTAAAAPEEAVDAETETPTATGDASTDGAAEDGNTESASTNRNSEPGTTSGGARSTSTGGGGGAETRSERDAKRRNDHPLSDVWGDG